jgi:heme/copper-type cytochrome/quinol oxidase subunit 2
MTRRSTKFAFGAAALWALAGAMSFVHPEGPPTAFSLWIFLNHMLVYAVAFVMAVVAATLRFEKGE